MLPHQPPFIPRSACSGRESENYSSCLGKRNWPERLGDLPKVTEQRQSKLSTPGWIQVLTPLPYGCTVITVPTDTPDSSSLHRTRVRQTATTWQASPGCGSSGLAPAGSPNPALLLQTAHPHPRRCSRGRGRSRHLEGGARLNQQ